MGLTVSLFCSIMVPSVANLDSVGDNFDFLEIFPIFGRLIVKTRHANRFKRQLIT